MIGLCLVLFVGYYGGITLFPHTHMVGGQLIVHSHPYSGSPSQSGHQHSAQQFQAVSLLSLLLFTGLLLLVLGTLFSRRYRLESFLEDALREPSYHPAHPLRGPPSV